MRGARWGGAAWGSHALLDSPVPSTSVFSSLGTPDPHCVGGFMVFSLVIDEITGD